MNNLKITSSVDLLFPADFSNDTVNKLKFCFRNHHTLYGAPVVGRCMVASERFDSNVMAQEKNNIEKNQNYFLIIAYNQYLMKNTTVERVRMKICETFKIMNCDQIIIIPCEFKFDSSGLGRAPENVLLPGYKEIIHSSTSSIVKRLRADLEDTQKIEAIHNLITIIDNYLHNRQRFVNTKNGEGSEVKEYFFPFFTSFQKSYKQKNEAVIALHKVLEGQSDNLLGHLSTLRDGKLGKSLRRFIKEGRADAIVGTPVKTVRDFVNKLHQLKDHEEVPIELN
ncbi:hypothetical protein [Legionella cardiaca]|uniref:Uncharacterized protein n=1 Tax=Legionella cardiaca TaxID=1071983 RepID=A0ABY8AMS9_9GAMM|nr:hypothetical protein [Legionella cardiaca]WED41960.1 hypothetical protein PXX05_08425 [Legionella cardiaca]